MFVGKRLEILRRKANPTTFKVAVAFFGITRSIPYTINSIEKFILEPLRASDETKIFAHFFDIKSIHNPRSGEVGIISPNQFELLNAQVVKNESPHSEEVNRLIEQVKYYGDWWNDEYQSLSNLIHQLHSLSEVSNLVLSEGYENCIFVRPDLRYHSSFKQYLRPRRGREVLVPSWQAWSGYNDRFSICFGRNAISAYGRRKDFAIQYCEENKSPLHSERLLKFALEKSNLKVGFLPIKATRVRFDGTEVNENFRSKRNTKFPFNIRKIRQAREN